MRYVLARFQQENREKAYRIYISDGIRLISENMAGLVNGKYMSMRYYDFIKPQEQDTRTAEDVITHIKHGLDKLGGG